MALTHKQKVFTNAYLATFNATEAARQAQYKGDDHTLASVGWENLRKPEIAKAISERLSAQAMTADEVLHRLADQARASMSDFVRFNDNAEPVFDLQAASMMGKLHLAKKLKTKTRSWSEPTINVTNGEIESREVTETAIEFELYDAQSALALIGKHHKLFSESVEVTGKDGGPIQQISMSVAEWKAQQEARRKQAADTMDTLSDAPDESDSNAE